MILEYTLVNDLDNGFSRLDVVNYLRENIKELSIFTRKKEMLSEIKKDYLLHMEKEENAGEMGMIHYLYCNIDNWLMREGIQYTSIVIDKEKRGYRGMIIEDMGNVHRVFIRDIGKISYIEERDSEYYRGDEDFNLSIFMEGTREEIMTMCQYDLCKSE